MNTTWKRMSICAVVVLTMFCMEDIRSHVDIKLATNIAWSLYLATLVPVAEYLSFQLSFDKAKHRE